MRGTDDKSPVYRLYAVVVHLDVMNAAFSGYYVYYVKDIQGKWYKVDDSMVKPVEFDIVLKQGAYMLFYARCFPRAPSLLRKTMVHGHGNTKDRSRRLFLQDMLERVTVRRSPVPCYYILHKIGDSSMLIRRPTTTDYGPFDLFSERHHPLQSPKTDSSCDRSLFSCSDAGSWSSDSTKGSTGADDYSDYIFGDSCSMKWNSPQRLSDDPDVLTALAYSPLGFSCAFEALSNVRSW